MNKGVVAVLLLFAAGPVLADDAHPHPAASPAAKKPAAAAKTPTVAPADTYFGPFGMSPLSIRSTIGFLGRQYHYRTISDHDLLRKALDTEFALRKWRAAYPADPWLPPTFFHLEQLYQAVQTDEARKHATAILKDVVRYYPASKQAEWSRMRLASGFPPLVAESPLVPSPAPTTQAPVATDSAAPAAGASPVEGAAPASPDASAMPSAGAAPTATPAAPATPQPSGT